MDQLFYNYLCNLVGVGAVISLYNLVKNKQSCCTILSMTSRPEWTMSRGEDGQQLAGFREIPFIKRFSAIVGGRLKMPPPDDWVDYDIVD